MEAMLTTGLFLIWALLASAHLTGPNVVDGREQDMHPADTDQARAWDHPWSSPDAVKDEAERSRLWSQQQQQRRFGNNEREAPVAFAYSEAFPRKSHVLFVDQSGRRGHYRRVQDAVNALWRNNRDPVEIQVAPGIYREQVIIPAGRGQITLRGSGMDKTIITHSLTAAKAGTQGSATFSIFAPRFTALDITFENSAPPAPPGATNQQAVALLVDGDMAAFYRCGIHGNQDTLYDKGGRHYFKNCDIRGSIDFIFGNAVSLYESCHLQSTAERLGGAPTGSLTANGRESLRDPSVFVFVGCVVDGTGSVYLGRAWGRHSRVVFIRSQFSTVIRAEGWNDWWDHSRDGTVYYAEYKCYGPGADRRGRVWWSHELSDNEANYFQSLNVIDGHQWLNSNR